MADLDSELFESKSAPIIVQSEGLLFKAGITNGAEKSTYKCTHCNETVAGQISALAAVAGNGGKSLNMSTLVSNSAWIIDSGAMDHMTFDSR